MIKVKYPSDTKELQNKYLEIFGADLKKMRKKWNRARQRNNFDFEFEDLLIGDFSKLVNIYITFKGQSISPKQLKRYKDIFNYEKYQSKIAHFFMDKDNGFNLHTCHYCNAAYINAYGLNNTYKSHLDFVNRATKIEWREYFPKKKTLSDRNLNNIIANRNFNTLEDFNGNGYLPRNIERYSHLKFRNNFNHFDLDHLLPKSKCPIIGLSLFNFVPSCQVCNEKLKRNKELGTIEDEWKKISPTYSGSSMADDVIIKLKSKKTCSTFFELNKNDDYYLDFETNGEEVYENYLQMFRLRDRYNYHKDFALRILDLKQRYTEEKCDQISSMLSVGLPDNEKKRYSKEQIMEDFFQEKFGEDRIFSKLRNDMLEHN